MDFARTTTLITGASTGIGAAFARELAARGSDLVVVARSTDKLRALADELTTAHGVAVEVLPLDLARPGAAEQLVQRVTELGREVDVLINNAGFATFGPVAESAPDRMAAEVQLNCLTLTDLTARLLPGMLARRRGAVVNIASTAAFQPVPRMAVYAATKAYVLSFTEALAAEVRGTGVQALAVCPGATETPFFAAAGDGIPDLGRRRRPEQVVAATLAALAKRRPTVVDGLQNRLMTLGPRLVSRRTAVAVAGLLTRPRRAA
ncbi:SDR family NAD(P)-dependent oxidoreductase [Kitasatospora sp. LaBMicrA B282]|uniref:SDR family NAD(P)-dependent oxidoreductase n=1 Tax=Kitasatospora sp. LaBMicrA B282 TaxID=3420949 RepID=UPI003D095CC7